MRDDGCKPSDGKSRPCAAELAPFVTRLPATRRVDFAMPVSVLAVPVSEVADQQTAKRTSSCANQSTFAAVCNTADYGAGCGAYSDVPFGCCTTGQGRDEGYRHH